MIILFVFSTILACFVNLKINNIENFYSEQVWVQRHMCCSAILKLKCWSNKQKIEIIMEWAIRWSSELFVECIIKYNLYITAFWWDTVYICKSIIFKVYVQNITLALCTIANSTNCSHYWQNRRGTRIDSW